MLDSDIQNADSQLSVEFYISREKGYEGRPFVRIMTPGDQLNVVDTFVREDHKERFPRQYLYFQMQNAEVPVSGTPIQVWSKECPEDCSEFQAAELTVLKFQTVEQVATASDGQLQRIGIGAEGLRNLSRMYLKKKREETGAESAQDLKTAQSEIADLKSQMAALMAKLSDPLPVEKAVTK